MNDCSSPDIFWFIWNNSFEFCGLIREVVRERVGFSQSPFSRIINILSEECFSSRSFFDLPLLLHKVWVILAEVFHRTLQGWVLPVCPFCPFSTQSIPHLAKEMEWPFLTFSWVFQLESLSFVVILTFHITFVNVSYKLFFFELTFPSYGS